MQVFVHANERNSRLLHLTFSLCNYLNNAICFRASLSHLDSRRFAFRRAPADVFDRSSESDRRQSLLCSAVCAPAQVSVGVVSGVLEVVAIALLLQSMQPPVMDFSISDMFSLSLPCVVHCECEMQDSSENVASAKTSFQIASMDAAGNVVVWTVVEKQVGFIIFTL
jgi:hypothetical protein